MEKELLLYLSQAEVVSVGLSMAEIIDLLEKAFREKGEGHVEMPPKPGIHPGGGDNFIHAMPAYIRAMGSAGLKWVSGFPDNHKRGLPYINGLLILNDPETGVPMAVMDCVWITAMLTAAATAVAARRLARPESASLPKMTWVHWVIYKIPAQVSGLGEDAARNGLPTGTREGRNDWKRTGYGGPCPPVGRHRYFHKLYALDTVLPDLGSATKASGRGGHEGPRDRPRGARGDLPEEEVAALEGRALR